MTHLRSFGVEFGIRCIAIILLAGCGGSSPEYYGSGRGSGIFEPGLPNFDMQARTASYGDSTGLSFHISIPNSSLVFLLMGDKYIASYEIAARLYDREVGTLILEKSWGEEVSVSTYEGTRLSSPRIVRHFLPATAGKYVLVVSIRDENTEKTAHRETPVSISGGMLDRASFVSLIWESRQNDGQYSPVIPAQLPSDHDSLVLVTTLNVPESGGQLQLDLVVEKFPADTAAASLPYHLSPPFGSRGYVGVEYQRSDTVFRTRKTSISKDRYVELRVPIPQLRRGVYKGVVHVRVRGQRDTIMAAQTNLVILRPGFPHLTTIDDLIGPLVYLARESDLDSVRRGASPQERRRRFDNLWLSTIRNEQAAANAIKAYYSRVEEANRFFTNHKEGWKTDRGMLYIVFGPPISIARAIDREAWHYSYATDDATNTYVFIRVRSYDENSPLENYILDRRPYYDRGWLNAVERWRRGAVF